MVKAYLRWQAASSMGVISSPVSMVQNNGGGEGIAFLPLPQSGPEPPRILLCCALEEVKGWDLNTGEEVLRINPFADDDPIHRTLIHSTAVAVSPDSITVAVGYSDGSIRLFDIRPFFSSFDSVVSNPINRTNGGGLTSLPWSSMKGHRSAVCCLRFSPDNDQKLYSGSQDTTLCAWDTTAEKGVCRLRGHTSPITCVCALPKSSRWGSLVVTSSKDGHIKVWDMQTEHCIQTLVGHRGEVSAMAFAFVAPSIDGGTNQDEQESAEGRLFSAGNEAVMRVWSLDLGFDKEEKKTQRNENGIISMEDDEVHPFHFKGAIERKAKGRVAAMCLSPSSASLAVASAGREIELYALHDRPMRAKRRRRRLARIRLKREKKQKKGVKKEIGDAKEEMDVDRIKNAWSQDADEQEFAITDEVSPLYTVHSPSKLSGVCFSPSVRKPMLAMALDNNTVQTVDLQRESSSVGKTLTMQGHRGDVRAVCLSSDGNLILTTSKHEAKLWNRRTARCIRTINVEYGLTVAFLSGNRYAVIGTNSGSLNLVDTASGDVLSTLEEAHKGPLWGLEVDQEGRGIITGSSDKTIKYWSVTLRHEDGQRCLGLEHEKTVEMSDDVLSLRLSNGNKFLAVALLDNTVKVFYADSLKFFLSIYGHSLPVMSADFSSDNTLLITGSADKNVKIWGCDFGDCRRSIFAHDDSVMMLRFLPKTHYFFSSGKDGYLKMWNADSYEQILSIQAHHSEIWGLCLDKYGDVAVTASRDRSIRVWEKSDEQLFLEEEKEKMLEDMFEDGLDKEVSQESETGDAAAQSIESLKAGERLMEALEMVTEATTAKEEYALALENAERIMPADEKISIRGGDGEDTTIPLLPPPTPNPLLIGRTPHEHLLHVLKGCRSNELEPALLALPYKWAWQLLWCVKELLVLQGGAYVELCVRVLLFLLRTHHHQLVAAGGDVSSEIGVLREEARSALRRQRDIIGFNRAAILHYKRRLAGEEVISAFREENETPPKAGSETGVKRRKQG